MESAKHMNEPILRVRDLYLRRGVRTVLDRVTFAVPRGGLVALMGPSGSGKTTILRAIVALERFESGTIEVGPLRLTGAPPNADALRALRRRVGLVFQFHHLFEHLTALANVSLAPVHAHGLSVEAAEARATALLAALGVEHRAHALPRELSGGEAQRVAIARALAVEPDLLMMDEPTASLDSARRAELGELLRRLVGQGRTILLATHDEEFAGEWATNVLRMADGKVVDSPDRGSAR